ncbi:MAG: precorrin-6y C5,15-methyltransferase (decarboxylating) subunit CbiE [Selenomonadaceae bacterium]|nr:precorrin-6y C5,15-methyltransferase (decarboxylating) subunit CbiE [Selenomonadaceae bacterium]
MRHRIIVAGIGPGHGDYMVPAAYQSIRSAKVLVGGRRALSQFAAEGQRIMSITRDIPAVLQFIREELTASDVVVMVSGDPGYYSMLDALRREFPEGVLRVIPGISSLQMAFSRLALPWHAARLLSFHGRRPEMEELAYCRGALLGMLTDGEYNSQKISGLLMQQGWPGKTRLFVCERLSYEDEKILRTTLEEAAKENGTGNCVLVIRDEMQQEG